MAPSLRANGSKRAQRGATTVEYVVLLTFVFLPCFLGFLLCYARVQGYYQRFVAQVSEPSP